MVVRGRGCFASTVVGEIAASLDLTTASLTRPYPRGLTSATVPKRCMATWASWRSKVRAAGEAFAEVVAALERRWLRGSTMVGLTPGHRTVPP